MKVKICGFSCSANFNLIYDVKPEDAVKQLISIIESIIPCTKICHILHNNNKLAQNKSFADYDISDGDILSVETNFESKSNNPACMGCSYYNLLYVSANITHGSVTKGDFRAETLKAAICHWSNKLDTSDQVKLNNFLNMRTRYHKTRFMVCVRDMLKNYVNAFRKMEYQNLIGFDYYRLLNDLRCPICLDKFSIISNISNAPIALCKYSEKHFVCENCFRRVDCCPLCKSKIQSQMIKSKYVLNQIEESKEKIENYCLPTTLNDINIKDTERPFASGAFCNIFRKEQFAIKCPRVPAVPGSDIETAIIHEIFLSRPLSHIPNILAVYGGVRLPTYGISIVMEYVDGQSLAEALAKNDMHNLSFIDHLDIALGICKGLAELHLIGIVHRDLKPENVLLQKNPSGIGYIPKIADFGVSFLIQTASATAVKKGAGTVGYDAPEVADGLTPSYQSDIYALSFILYELFTGHRPFRGLKEAQIIRKFTIQGDRPQNWDVHCADETVKCVPKILKNTIEKGWLPEAESRANIGEIIGAIRKARDNNYRRCVEMLYESSTFCNDSSSYDFMNSYDDYELLVIQEIIKRIVIEDAEMIKLLLNNPAWG